jgi:site-specific recombinase XerD
MKTAPQKTANRDMIRQKTDGLKAWADAFLRDCKTRGLSAFTNDYYRSQLAYFIGYCAAQGVEDIPGITPDLVRSYLLELEADGHNAGGRHAKYRALRAFLNWWEREAEPDGWVNPLTKVRPPKVAITPIDPVPVSDIKAMLATCGEDFRGYRDRAILLCLLDTGARVREFLGLNLEDVDTIGGGVIIRKGKGGKPRVVFLGKKSRKALRAYLKQRADDNPALWVTRDGERLAVKSLQGMLQRRAKFADVPAPSPHDFRRAFALGMLRAGTDVFSLQKLMGHESLDVLRRYLAQTDEDLRTAHESGGPVDGIFK